MGILSRAEELILLAVWRLQKEAYGATILNLLTEQTGTDWSIAGVYAPLKRLSSNGFLLAIQGHPTPERGGRSKRYYQLTQKGVSALGAVKSINEQVWKNLPEFAIAS